MLDNVFQTHNSGKATQSESIESLIEHVKEWEDSPKSLDDAGKASIPVHGQILPLSLKGLKYIWLKVAMVIK